MPIAKNAPTIGSDKNDCRSVNVLEATLTPGNGNPSYVPEIPIGTFASRNIVAICASNIIDSRSLPGTIYTLLTLPRTWSANVFICCLVRVRPCRFLFSSSKAACNCAARSFIIAVSLLAFAASDSAAAARLFASPALTFKNPDIWSPIDAIFPSPNNSPAIPTIRSNAAHNSTVHFVDEHLSSQFVRSATTSPTTPIKTIKVEISRKVPHQLSSEVSDASLSSIIAQRIKRDAVVNLMNEGIFGIVVSGICLLLLRYFRRSR
jgi:hypothetical protein